LKLLLIISQYAPAQTPNTLRWIPLLNHFAELGHQVYVLTTKRKGISDLDTQGKIKVYRAGYNTLYDFISDLINLKSRRNETGQNSYDGQLGVGRLFAEKFIDKTWRKNYWPDGSKLFLKAGIKTGLKVIEENNITNIISVGLPFTPHLIAKNLKEKEPSIHWHMDIQDPFSYSKEFWVNNFKKYEQKNIEAEGETFKLANTISLTNSTAQDRYVELFPKSASKIAVIPPLFLNLKKEIDSDLFLYNQKVHLGYFGSFYKGVRSPKRFLEFLVVLHRKDPSLFDKIQIHFFGQQNKFSTPLLNAYPEIRRYFILHGFLDRNKSLSCMKEMDVLINFGNSTDYHLPSKVVDLLYMNKPIVNFTACNNDTTASFLKDKVEILNLNLNTASANDEKQFLDFIFKSRDRKNPNLNKVNDFLTDVIGEMYLNQIT